MMYLFGNTQEFLHCVVLWWLLLHPVPCLLAGTVNIHPSLLPLYRGASPVQRALEVRSSLCELRFPGTA